MFADVVCARRKLPAFHKIINSSSLHFPYIILLSYINPIRDFISYRIIIIMKNSIIKSSILLLGIQSVSAFTVSSRRDDDDDNDEEEVGDNDDDDGVFI